MLVIVILGCNRGTANGPVPVHGRVTLDGQPLTSGWVLFTPEAGRGARGAIQPDGTFRMSTYKEGDGALSGLNRVAIVANQQEASEEVNPEAPTQLLTPAKYANPATSGLTFTVSPEGDNEAVFELDSRAAR